MTDPVKTQIRNLSSCQPAKRLTAAKKLATMGEAAAPAAVALVEALDDESEEVLQQATAALEELGPPPLEHRTRLAELLSDENPDVGYWAATLLGRLKKEAEDTVADLCRTVEEHPEASVKERAVWALGQIGSPDARRTLEEASQSSNRRLSRLAEKALSQTGDAESSDAAGADSE